MFPTGALFRTDDRCVVTQMDTAACVVRFSACLPALPAALRRVLLSEIPALAIADVSERVNTTATATQLIAQRVRLLPILSHGVRSMNTPFRCQCQAGCPRCEVVLEMRSRLPDGATDMGWATAADITVGRAPDGSAVGVVPAALTKRLAPLQPGEELCLTLVVRKGSGRVPGCGASFQVGAAIEARYDPHLIVDTERAAQKDRAALERYVRQCPSGVLGVVDDGAGGPRISLVNPDACTFCGGCSRAVDLEDADMPLVTVVHRRAVPGTGTGAGAARFAMRLGVHTKGQLPPDLALLSAVRELRARLRAVRTGLQRCGAPVVGVAGAVGVGCTPDGA